MRERDGGFIKSFIVETETRYGTTSREIKGRGAKGT